MLHESEALSLGSGLLSEFEERLHGERLFAVFLVYLGNAAERFVGGILGQKHEQFAQ